MADFPRDDLIRMTVLESAQLRMADDGTTLTGYAALFDTPTVIDSWEGRFEERIMPGAFSKTLAERGDQIKVLFNHGFDPMIGDKPLGKPSVMREDSKGLYVEVPLDDTSYNRDLMALLRSGALDGQSFRFSVPAGKDDWEYGGDIDRRQIREAKLFEFGPVTFPAYEATSAGLRMRGGQKTNISQEPPTGTLPEPPNGTPTSEPLTHSTRKQRQQDVRRMRRALTFQGVPNGQVP